MSMFIWVVIVLAIVSIILSVWSLKKENEKREIVSAKKELEKGKILYKS